MKSVAWALLLTLAGCWVAGCSRAVKPQPAADETVTARSSIKGASLVSLTQLPRSPENGATDSYCDSYRAQKLTPVGQQVAKLGWIVTSEAPLGKYHVVTFASGFDAGTSGMCAARNANIGVFDGPNLLALAYTSRSAKLTLGAVEAVEGGALLVWGGGWTGPPIGELRTENHSLQLTAIAPEQSFCQGKAIVPRVYGKSIDDARKILVAHGWKPLRSSEAPDDFDEAKELVRRGIVEVESCSGTGVGYCAFDYRSQNGLLRVTTIGGSDPSENSVVSYTASCPAA